MYTIVLGLVAEVVSVKLREYDRDRKMDPVKRDEIYRNIGRIFTEVRPAMSDKRARKLKRLALQKMEEDSLKEGKIDEHFPHINQPVSELMKVFIAIYLLIYHTSFHQGGSWSLFLYFPGQNCTKIYFDSLAITMHRLWNPVSINPLSY